MAQYNESILIDKKNEKTIRKIAEENIPEGEKIYVALKGAFKEFLFCTDKQVYIIKKGFMTGHTMGSGDFKMPYRNITNVQVDFKFVTGYFEVASGGMQNTDKSYWNTQGKGSASQQPNSISLNDKKMSVLFKEASNFIMDKVHESHSAPSNTHEIKESPADELIKFKQLLDMDVITQEEFDKKKMEILG